MEDLCDVHRSRLVSPRSAVGGSPGFAPGRCSASADYSDLPSYPREEAPWPPGAASRWWLHHSLAAQSEPFDPDGAYLRQWLPELAKLSTSAIQQPWTLAQAESMAINAGLSRDYPRPVVDLAASRVEALVGYARLKAD